MFALFTKVSWLVLQPSSLIAMALLVGLALLWRDRIGAARRWLGGGIAALLICGFGSLSDVLIIPLEDRFPRPNLDTATITGLIVLGGSEDARVGGARGVIAVNDAGERIIEIAALARRFSEARLLVSGGGDVTSDATESEAATASRILQALGVAASRITMEDRSRTTWENAVFSLPLMAQKSGERWLLVTSAWQMPRAIGAFRKAGVTVEAYPVDYRTTGYFSATHLHPSLTDGLRRFDTVVREYPALLIYWLTGRSSALFPAP